MNPLTLYPVLALVAVLVTGGFYKYGYKNGWKERDNEMQLVIAKRNEEARQKEQDMAKAMTEKDAELRKANDDVSKKQTDLNRLIAAGRVRLPSASCVQASQNPAASTGDRTEARSEPNRQADQPSDSERETLQLIAQIAADGDKAINQLNACISAYNEVMERVNADR
jgi:hypothetical protein